LVQRMNSVIYCNKFLSNFLFVDCGFEIR
jgi:hypothetical protein